MDKITPPSITNSLEIVLYKQKLFDSNSIQELQFALSYLQINFPSKPSQIIELHNALLFILAYPANETVFKLANQLLSCLVERVSRAVKKDPNAFYNSGITGSQVCAQFGLLLNQYLLNENLETCELAGIDGDNTDLVSKLTYTLDSVEQELMPGHAGYFKNWKKRYLPNVNTKNKLLNYYVHASLQMDASISHRESVFAGFQVFTQFSLDQKLLGLSTGRLPFGKPYLHINGIQKKCSVEEVLAFGKPKQLKLEPNDKSTLVRLARGSMASLLRETDTFTYCQEHETELFDMGNGISIALYYMIPEQKFALQSYVGYLLFKNGLPMAYGGCWITAFQAAFGVNVLPPYRGGESSLVVAQLLRLYKSRFNIYQFTVDPYQIGQGNSDGIKSGAFWFYYKLGFRPMQANLAQLAEEEMAKMMSDKTYRTPTKTLVILADADIYLQLKAGQKYIPLLPLSDKISEHVSHYFGGNRAKALQVAQKKYAKIFGKKLPSSSFLNRLLVFIDALGAFEKLNQAVLEKVCQAYQLKAENEAKAHAELQGLKAFWKLID
ncbi:MAG: hypothetical protein CFE21_15075 [Bacteroidetes bacterium B1(2017)]|nr:MAG: hypothetical protein CFE21_15075 [Bacteroidetes bacterium B1(2017)]